MLSIEQNFLELLSEEVILFTEDCSPYYVSPAVSRDLWNKAENNSLIEEVSRIVHTVSSLNLCLSYIMPLHSAPTGSAVRCSVSKFSHGYKVMLIEDSIAKHRTVTTGTDVHEACYKPELVT